MSKTSHSADKAFPTVFDPAAMLRSFMTKQSDAPAFGVDPVAYWLEMHQHWTRFLTERFNQDVAMVQRLATCANPTELNAAYSEFYTTALADYQKDFAEMTELGQKAMSKVFASGHEDAKASPRKPRGRS